MNHRLLSSVAITFTLLVPLRAQEVSPEFKIRVERAEDMETFATILLENLQRCYAENPAKKRSARRGGYEGYGGGYGEGGGYGSGGYGEAGGYGEGGGYGGAEDGGNGGAGGYGIRGRGGSGYGGAGGDEFGGLGGGGGYGDGGGSGLGDEEGGDGGNQKDDGGDGGYGTVSDGSEGGRGRYDGFGMSGGFGMPGGGGFGGMGGAYKRMGDFGNAKKRNPNISTPIAAYLAGQGVVVTVDVPATSLPWEHLRESKDEEKSSRAAPSRWQKAKEQVSTNRMWAHGHWMTKTQCSKCHEGTFSSSDSKAAATSLARLVPKSAGPSLIKVVEAIADALFESTGNIRHLPESESISVVVRYRRWRDGLSSGLPAISNLEFQTTGTRATASIQRLPASFTIRVPAKSVDKEDPNVRAKYIRAVKTKQHVTFFDPGYAGKMSLEELQGEVDKIEKANSTRRGRGRR